MTTRLQHSDYILKAAFGSWLMAGEPVRGVNMRSGGTIDYPLGARFRVKFSNGDLIWCLDESARSVSFDRDAMHALDRMEQS